MSASPSTAVHIRARDAFGQVVDVARVQAGTLTVGSAAHNALVLPSPNIAPTQLRIDWDGASKHITVTNLGERAVSLGQIDIQPQGVLAWDGIEQLVVGPYSLRLIGMSSLSHPSPLPTGTSRPKGEGERTPAKRIWWPVIVSPLLALLAVALLVLSIVGAPAEIVSFAFSSDAGAGRKIEFQVRNAQRIALVVDGRPADAARLQWDTQTGDGTFTPDAQEQSFELMAFNALNQPARSRLDVALAPTPSPSPNPTATPLPGQPFVAEFTFNGVNKASELSDVLLNRGEGLVIAWSVANVDGVELLPAGTFKAIDSVRVAPQETTVYTLQAVNPFGEARRSVKVIVVDAQATAMVDATVAAGAAATQQAMVDAQSQAAATATQSAQATSTAIAAVLADAQARATQAAGEVVATGTAQAAIITQGTAQASATQQAAGAISATSTAIVQGTAQAGDARFAQFSGTWVNSAPANTGLQRLVIANAGPAISVQAWDACSPQPCALGQQTVTYTDAPFVVRYDFGDGSARTFVLTRDGDALKVQDFPSSGPARVYTFVRGT
jgi:hypothetical protein